MVRAFAFFNVVPRDLWWDNPRHGRHAKRPCTISGRDRFERGKRLHGSAGASHSRDRENPFRRLSDANAICGSAGAALPGSRKPISGRKSE